MIALSLLLLAASAVHAETLPATYKEWGAPYAAGNSPCYADDFKSEDVKKLLMTGLKARGYAFEKESDFFLYGDKQLCYLKKINENPGRDQPGGRYIAKIEDFKKLSTGWFHDADKFVEFKLSDGNTYWVSKTTPGMELVAVPQYVASPATVVLILTRPAAAPTAVSQRSCTEAKAAAENAATYSSCESECSNGCLADVDSCRLICANKPH